MKAELIMFLYISEKGPLFSSRNLLFCLCSLLTEFRTVLLIPGCTRETSRGVFFGFFFLMLKSGCRCRPMRSDFQRGRPAALRMSKCSSDSSPQRGLRNTWSLRGSGSQSVVPGPTPSASPGNLLDTQILSPTPDLPNRIFWG